MMFKKILALVCAVLCFSLTACSSSATTQSEESSSNIENVVSVAESNEELSSSSYPSSGVASSEVSSNSTASTVEEPHVSPWEQKQAMISELDPFDFQTEAARNVNYKGLEYSDILRNINQYIGQKVTFHGVVKQLKRDSITSTGLLFCGNDPDYDESFVVTFSYDGYPNFIEGDQVYLYGVISGISQYATHDNSRDDGEVVHETFNLDTYFYEPDTKTESYTMTPQEQKYYYGDYTVYDYFQTNFVPLHVDFNGINGHPYQVLSCDKSPDGIYMHVQFTEFLGSYSKRDTLGKPYDIVWLQPSGNIFLEIGSGVSEDLGYYYDNIGWNKKYGKPAWTVRKEQEIGKQAD